jgi:serine/threonine-protein kinase HipA
MALKMNGKDDRLRRSDFKAFASTAGIKASDADAAIDELISQLEAALRAIALPSVVPAATSISDAAERMLTLIKERLDDFA